LEAIAAIDRFVATRLERHFCHAAALAAGCAEFFALTAKTAAATCAAAALLRFTRRTTVWATVGLVLEAFHCEKFLFAGRKRERTRTINAI
jgi:hypothetical protein